MKRLLAFLCFIIPISLSAQIITTIAGTDSASYSGDGGAAINAKLNNPAGLAFDKNGNLYFADFLNSVIRKIDTNGIITTIAGTGVAGYSGDGGPAVNAELNTPTGIAFDDTGNLYIAGWLGMRIRKVDTHGIISTITGTGVNGYSGDGGLAINAKVSYPYSIAFDHADNLYFSDAGNHRIRKIDHAGIITTFAGTGISGYTGDGGPALSAEIGNSAFIHFDDTDQMYLPDVLKGVVRKINTSGIISTIIGNGSSTYSGDGGSAIDAGLNGPSGFAMDKMGNIYISCGHSDVIRKINTSGIISTIAGTGVAGYSGDGGPAIDAKLQAPVAILLDSKGDLIIADSWNNRIRKITFPTGINNISRNKHVISIYPNPSTDRITVSSDKPIKSVQIMNTLGQTVFSQTYAHHTQTTMININTLPQGVYMIRVNNVQVKELTKL